ncbi:hypothetical protein NKH77_53375 [Streptomyces sp. M19]
MAYWERRLALPAPPSSRTTTAPRRPAATVFTRWSSSRPPCRGRCARWPGATGPPSTRCSRGRPRRALGPIRVGAPPLRHLRPQPLRAPLPQHGGPAVAVRHRRRRGGRQELRGRGRRDGPELLPAYRGAAYDLDALDALRERLREEAGELAAPRLFLNLTNSKSASAAPDPEAGESVEELVARSRFRRIAQPVAGWTDLYLGIRPYRDYTGFFARGDGRSVSRPPSRRCCAASRHCSWRRPGTAAHPADLRAIAGT